MGSKEASHESLAKIISTNVSIQFFRGLDDLRFDASRGARVHRPARARVGERLGGWQAHHLASRAPNGIASGVTR